MDFPDPGHLRKKAHQCLRTADQIEAVAIRLRLGAKSTLGSEWTGQAAVSLDTAVEDQISDLNAAARKLRDAADALNAGAVEVDRAIAAEKRRIAAEKRAEEERRKALVEGR